MKKMFVLFACLYFAPKINAQTPAEQTPNETTAAEIILPGAYQTGEYLPLLKDKRVGVFANPTSMIGSTHLVDSLQKLGINITKIFGPEHGFRGTADAGEQVDSYIDAQTGVTVISLYGKKVKPDSADLADIDILLFDIQDVGVRFYTYISSLQYFIESAMQNNLPLVILDRPNPNGFYVDGPVLDSGLKSFIGMQPIPVVYGMTLGEYARMLLGEKWVSRNVTQKQQNKMPAGQSPAGGVKRSHFMLTVIRCKNYTHKSKYQLPVKPSPNLADMASIYAYPSTCFFEGTNVTEGRGTDHPFAIFGHPSFPKTLYAFTPHSTEGAKDPKFKDKQCYGWNIMQEPQTNRIELKWLLQAYGMFKDKDSFFIRPKNPLLLNYFFNKLAGNVDLMKQLQQGSSEQEIRNSWQPKLLAFKRIRQKYLLYADF